MQLGTRREHTVASNDSALGLFWLHSSRLSTLRGYSATPFRPLREKLAEVAEALESIVCATIREMVLHFAFVRVCGSIPAQGKLVQTNY